MSTYLRIVRGDDRTFDIGPVTDADSGAPIDLTGAAIAFVATGRDGAGDPFSITHDVGDGGIVITGGPAGEAELRIAAADTADAPDGSFELQYSVRMTVAGKVRTLLEGLLRVDGDVRVPA